MNENIRTLQPGYKEFMDQINSSCEKFIGGLRVHLPLPHYSHGSIHMSWKLNGTIHIPYVYFVSLTRIKNPFLYKGDIVRQTTTFMLVQVHPQVACPLRNSHGENNCPTNRGWFAFPTQVPSFK